jgi:hypothetical protein
MTQINSEAKEHDCAETVETQGHRSGNTGSVSAEDALGRWLRALDLGNTEGEK